MTEDLLADLRAAAEVLGCDLVIVPPDRDQERPADGFPREP